MKESIVKMIITLAAIALVLPFVALAFLVGAQAVAGAENLREDLLLVVLALGGAAASMLKNMNRKSRTQGNASTLHIASRPAGRNSHGAFMNVPSQTSCN